MPSYHISFWNCENLFDVEKSPRRTDKLERAVGSELKGWTQAVLDKKIGQLASIIKQLNAGKGPDILSVCEIENRYVLELLAKALKPLGRTYEIVHADTKDERGIDVAFIYDGKLFKAEKTFFHFIVKRTATRDIVQVNFKTAAGRQLVLVGNHWPARSAGKYESEPFRIIAGETLAYFHERIIEELGKKTPVLAMGDFNDEPFDRSLMEHARCERQRAKVVNAKSPSFLNLMWPLAGQGIGSYYFENEPNLLDQFLASRSLLTGDGKITVVENSVRIERFPEMVRKGDYPAPIRFGRGTDMNPKGFSDHFPVSVRIEEA